MSERDTSQWRRYGKNCLDAIKSVIKTLLHGPLFNDLTGRLSVFLHLILETVCFVIIIVCLANDAKWWRETALAESYKVCRAYDSNIETLELCKAFVSDLEFFLKVLATAVACICFKFFTVVGSICSSNTIAKSVRLDQGNWLDTNKVVNNVNQFRQNKQFLNEKTVNDMNQYTYLAKNFTPNSSSKPCQWKAAVTSCVIWGVSLTCDTITLLVVLYHLILFRIQVTEYSNELFPDVENEYPLAFAVINLIAIGCVLIIDVLLFSAAIFKIQKLNEMPDNVEEVELDNVSKETDKLLLNYE